VGAALPVWSSPRASVGQMLALAEEDKEIADILDASSVRMVEQLERYEQAITTIDRLRAEMTTWKEGCQ
jgi:hypothetical protein